MTRALVRPPFDRSLVDGPISPAVWMLAWPAMMQNFLTGVQGILDHVLVGHFLGYTANAAVGVGWQIFGVFAVMSASVFSGQAILVARSAGAGDAARVNRIVQQALITAIGMFAVMGTAGSLWGARLLDLVAAAPEVKAQAVPFLRINFACSFGMMLLVMISTALRAAGDARTPLRLGIAMTVLNVILDFVLIRGLGPIPSLGAAGAAAGTAIGSGTVSGYALYRLLRGGFVIRLGRDLDWRPDPATIRSLFRLGLPTGVQAILLSVAGVAMLRFVGSLPASAAAQAAYAIVYTEVFAMLIWTSAGLASATVAMTGQNLGAGRPDRVMLGVRAASRIGITAAAIVGAALAGLPDVVLWAFGAAEGDVVVIGRELLRYVAVAGFFMTAALVHTGGLHGAGDTTSPLVITLASQVAIPLGMCATVQAVRPLEPADIWIAIVLGHATRCVLSVLRFRQQRWLRAPALERAAAGTGRI